MLAKVLVGCWDSAFACPVCPNTEKYKHLVNLQKSSRAWGVCMLYVAYPSTSPEDSNIGLYTGAR